MKRDRHLTDYEPVRRGGRAVEERAGEGDFLAFFRRRKIADAPPVIETSTASRGCHVERERGTRERKG